MKTSKTFKSVTLIISIKIWVTIAMVLGLMPVFAQYHIAVDLNAQQFIDSSKREEFIDTIPMMNDFYEANNQESTSVFVYPEISLKNIRIYKRVWSDIDLKDEKNSILAAPRNSLIEIIMKSIDAGNLSLFSPDDDTFIQRMSASAGMARFKDSLLVPIFDNEGNQISSKMTLNEFDPTRVTKFRIKEVIFFDMESRQMDSRISGIAPLMNITTSAELAQSVGSTPAFWLYFPELRYYLGEVDSMDPGEGIDDMTMDDLFFQKKYASTIIRESSMGDLKLGDEIQQVDDTQHIEQKIDTYNKELLTSPKGVKEENLEELILNAQNPKKVKKK